MSMMMKSYWGAVYAYPIVEIVSALLAIWVVLQEQRKLHGSNNSLFNRQFTLFNNKHENDLFSPLLLIIDFYTW